MKKELEGVKKLLINLYGHSNVSVIKDLISQVKEANYHSDSYKDSDTLFKLDTLKIAIDIHKEYFITGDIDFVELEKFIDRVYPKFSRSVKLKKILK